MTYPTPFEPLGQTIRVGMDPSRLPTWGGIGIPEGVEYGIEVRHEAVNIPCGQFLGRAEPWGPGNGIIDQTCRKRVGHATPKDTTPHVAVDHRVSASPRRVVHGPRFAPSGIPAGVDQNVVNIPHDCSNHLPDTEKVLRRGW